MDSIVLLVLVVIGLIILAKQGWLGLMSDTADVVKSKMNRKIVEIEAEDQYTHAKNLGKVASKWQSNDKPLADIKIVKDARSQALAKFNITE